jgi:hypothetical protein
MEIWPDEPGKKCPQCKEFRPQSEFSRDRARPDGLAFYCKGCFSRQAAAAYRRKRARAGKTVRDRVVVPDGFKACSLCQQVKSLDEFHVARAQAKGRNCYCKPCRSQLDRAKRFMREYGLTEQALVELIESQGGVCAICRYRPAEHVDHDHLTGEVRGVLCFPCNAALGHFKDRIDLLMRAANYLETSTWQKSRTCTGVFRLTSPRPARRPSPTSSALHSLISSHRAAVTSPPA